MKFRVEVHPKGIALLEIATGESADAVRLRKILDVPVSPLPNRGYLVPRDAAHKVLNRFPPNENDWEQSALRFAQEQKANIDLQSKALLEVNLALENPISVLADYPLTPRLDEHQLVAVAAISAPSLRGLALFDEQGTGKTIMALAGFDRLRQVGKVERLLVVTPKSVVASWRTECHNFFGTRYRVSLVQGTSTQRRRIIQQHHDVLLISYDTLIREAGLLKVWAAAQPNKYMLVIDESYFIKNPSTFRAKAIAEIRPFCERAIILCGTPAPNSPLDIVNQINIADQGVAFKGQAVPEDKYQARTEINDALNRFIYLRRLKEDVFPEIPVKQIEHIQIELQPIQRKLYDKARDELVIAVRSVDDREFQRHLQSYLDRQAVLLQICSNPNALDPLYIEQPAKLLALDRLVKELVEDQGKKVVIWSFFRHSLKAIAERLKQFGVARIDGSVPNIESRLEAIYRFQTDPDTKVFVGNTASAGAGITLTAAHHAIYESFSNQAAHYMQSVDRIHRRGQMHDVTYHVLIANNTIEEREFERLLQKERASRDLLGDRYNEPITRERFLTDLGEQYATST